jgi:hypothetical protein
VKSVEINASRRTRFVRRKIVCFPNSLSYSQSNKFSPRSNGEVVFLCCNCPNFIDLCNGFYSDPTLLLQVVSRGRQRICPARLGIGTKNNPNRLRKSLLTSKRKNSGLAGRVSSSAAEARGTSDLHNRIGVKNAAFTGDEQLAIKKRNKEREGGLRSWIF